MLAIDKKKHVRKLKHADLVKLDAASERQGDAITSFKNDGNNIVLSGSAGTGKTYLAIALALDLVLDKTTTYEKVLIVRSILPVNNPGFLPGTKEEKEEVYTAPYKAIVGELIPSDPVAYHTLVNANVLAFESTSYMRGATYNDTIIVLDEMQNCTGRELDTVITRVGNNSRFIMAGDFYQSDIKTNKDKSSILDFLRVLQEMKQFEIIKFTWEDIIRSSFVRDYIMTKEMLKIGNEW